MSDGAEHSKCSHMMTLGFKGLMNFGKLTTLMYVCLIICIFNCHMFLFALLGNFKCI